MGKVSIVINLEKVKTPEEASKIIDAKFGELRQKIAERDESILEVIRRKNRILGGSASD